MEINVQGFMWTDPLVFWQMLPPLGYGTPCSPWDCTHVLPTPAPVFVSQIHVSYPVVTNEYD